MKVYQICLFFVIMYQLFLAIFLSENKGIGSLQRGYEFKWIV